MMKDYIAAIRRRFQKPAPVSLPVLELLPEIIPIPAQQVEVRVRFEEGERIERLAAPVLGGLIAGFPGAWETVNPDFVRVAREYAKELIRQGEKA